MTRYSSARLRRAAPPHSSLRSDRSRPAVRGSPPKTPPRARPPRLSSSIALQPPSSRPPPGEKEPSFLWFHMFPPHTHYIVLLFPRCSSLSPTRFVFTPLQPALSCREHAFGNTSTAPSLETAPPPPLRPRAQRGPALTAQLGRTQREGHLSEAPLLPAHRTHTLP